MNNEHIKCPYCEKYNDIAASDLPTDDTIPERVACPHCNTEFAICVSIHYEAEKICERCDELLGDCDCDDADEAEEDAS